MEKAEAKLQQKQQIKKEKNASVSGVSNATASQVLTKKENRMEAKGTNNCKDIRIENFDIAFGEKYVRFYTVHYIEAGNKTILFFTDLYYKELI